MDFLPNKGERALGRAKSKKISRTQIIKAVVYGALGAALCDHLARQLVDLRRTCVALIFLVAFLLAHSLFDHLLVQVSLLVFEELIEVATLSLTRNGLWVERALFELLLVHFLSDDLGLAALDFFDLHCAVFYRRFAF